MGTYTLRLGPTFASEVTTFKAVVDKLGALDFEVGIQGVNPALKAVAKSNPGVASIVVSVVDPTPGAGQPAGCIKMALTQPGLDAAIAGAPLDLGVTELLPGESNRITWFVRVTDLAGLPDTLQLTMSTLQEAVIE